MTRPLKDWTDERLLYMYAMLNQYNPEPKTDWDMEIRAQYFKRNWGEAMEDAKQEILIRMKQQ